MFNTPLSGVLVAGIIAAFVSITSIFVAPLVREPALADIRFEPQDGTIEVGKPFKVSVIVEANTPVNVFSGLVTFNPRVLSVASIDYNTSIADLWAVKPWYDNGDGTLDFAGGTVRPGGFTGTDTLITITFNTNEVGASALTLQNGRILKHDGLGTDVELSEAPIDALFTVAPEILEEKTIVKKDGEGGLVRITPQPHVFDLNGDGLDTYADVSIFMIHLSEQNLRSDFNHDGVVNIYDANLLLSKP